MVWDLEMKESHVSATGSEFIGFDGFSSVQSSSVTQSCLTLCDPMTFRYTVLGNGKLLGSQKNLLYSDQ